MSEANIIKTISEIKDLLSNPFYDFSDKTCKGKEYREALIRAISYCEALIEIEKTNGRTNSQ